MNSIKFVSCVFYLLFSNEYAIRQHIKTHGLIFGSVCGKGGKALKRITREVLKEMRPEMVIADVAVDKSGCFETTKPTTHEVPTYIIDDDVVHYCVANIPRAVPYTSTLACTNVSLPFLLKGANNR